MGDNKYATPPGKPTRGGAMRASFSGGSLASKSPARSSFNLGSGNSPFGSKGNMAAMKKGKSMKGASMEEDDPDIRRSHAHNSLLPMVLESMTYGPMIPASRNYMKILVADPSDEVLRVMSEYLTLKACEVLTLRNGVDVQERLEIEDFDVAFINFDLSGADGISIIGGFSDMIRRDCASRLGHNQSVAEQEEGVEDDVQDLDAAFHAMSSGTPKTGSGVETDLFNNSGSLPGDAVAAIGHSGTVGMGMIPLYNPNMLLVGLDVYPSSRVAEAHAAGMHVYIPSNPTPMDFVGRIVTLWRTNEGSMRDGIAEIQSVSPVLAMDAAAEAQRLKSEAKNLRRMSMGGGGRSSNSNSASALPTGDGEDGGSSGGGTGENTANGAPALISPDSRSKSTRKQRRRKEVDDSCLALLWRCLFPKRRDHRIYNNHYSSKR